VPEIDTTAPTAASHHRPWRKVALIVILSLIGLQVVLWLTILVLDQSSIQVALGAVGGNQLMMILFWGGVACVLVLIFAALATFARDHRAAGVTLITLTALATIVLGYIAMIAISIVGYQSYTHFSLARSGNTYTIESSKSLFEGGGPSVAVYRSHGPFFQRPPVAEDHLGSGWSPFADGDYYVLERGDEVIIRYGQLPGDDMTSEMTFTDRR